MATDYQGIKIYDEVIIVEKESWHWENGNSVKLDIPQGYVVEVGNKNMLDTALRWAKQSRYAIDDSGNYLYDEKGYHIYNTIEGKINTYKNGNFKIIESLSNGFGYSWNLFYGPLTTYGIIIINLLKKPIYHKTT